jgi:hypothetical protein
MLGWKSVMKIKREKLKRFSNGWMCFQKLFLDI